MSLTFEVRRDLQELGPAADRLRGGLIGTLGDEEIACVELAFVEALTNSIRHGPSNGQRPISVFLDVTEKQVAVEIEDGSSLMPGLFDGAGEEQLDFDLDDLENLPEGGRGLSLIVISMDEVSFRQTGAQVRLRMVRNRA